MSFETFFPISMADHVPTGRVGVAEVRYYAVSEAEASLGNMRALMHGHAEDMVRPGRYAQLLVRGELMMSDTDMEKRTNLGFVRNAKGRVLVAGLGLGLILHKVIEKPEVSEITIVEKYSDVVALVGGTLPQTNEKAVSIVTADIFDWKPLKGQKFDTIYFDVWSNICTDNLKNIARLKRRFCHHLALGGWMGAWAENRLRYESRRERRAGW